MTEYPTETNIVIPDLIMSTTIISALIIFAIVFCGKFFRSLIIGNALYGMDTESNKKLMESQTLPDRLFMTYIWKFSLEGKRKMGFAIWFLVWHCIHIISSLTVLIWGWYEVYLFVSSGREIIFAFYVFGMRITHGNVVNTLLALIMLSLPVSILLAVPITAILRKSGKGDSSSV